MPELTPPQPRFSLSSHAMRTKSTRRMSLSCPTSQIHQRVGRLCWMIVFSYGVTVTLGGCSSVIPKDQKNWQLVWQDGRWRHYYVDTSTIRIAGDTATAVAWDVSILANRSGIRNSLPRVETTREDLKVQCGTNIVLGVGVTSIARLHQYGDGPFTVFADTPNVAGPHSAVAQFICARWRVRYRLR